MHSYIILETKKDPVSFRKKKRGEKKKGTILHEEERADKFMLVSRGLPIFVS